MASNYTPEEIAELKAREADEIKRLGKATIETRMAMMDAAAGVKGLTANLTKGFSGMLGSLGTSALGLTKALSEGEVGASVFNNSIGSVANALGDLLGLIPYVGGALKTLVKGASEYTQAVNKQADLLYKNYQDMSQIGATVADGMQGVYDNLKRMNYGTEELDKFVSIVKENSQTLSSFGGTVNRGLGQMAAASQAMQDSGMSQQFQLMGISIDDINKGIASFTKMQMVGGLRQKMTIEELTAASASYIKEIDLLAKVTGMTRSEQEQAKESAMAEERYAAYKIELQQRAALGGAQGKAAEEQLKQVERTQMMLGKVDPEMRKGFLNILSGTLNTPEAKKLLLTMPEAAAVAGKETFTANEFMAAANKDAQKNITGGGLQLAKIGANNDSFLSIQGQSKLLNMQLNGTLEENLEAADKQQIVTDQSTKNINDLNIANRKSRDSLQDMINAGIVPVTHGMKGLAGATEDTIKGFEKMAEKLGITVRKREAAPAPAPAPVAPAGKPKITGALKDDLLKRLSSSGITNENSQANVLAQLDAESAGKVDNKENLDYTPEQLLKTFPKKFKDLAEAQSVVSKGQEAIGNKIYGGRMGNAENEGFLYRGRGLVQLTGKQNYEKFGKLLGIDLVKNPDLAADPEFSKQIAVAYFAEKQKAGVNLADISAIGKAVGYAGGSEETQKRAQLAEVYKQNKSVAANNKPQENTVTTAAEAAKSRADFAANDPRRVAAPTEAKPTEAKPDQSSSQPVPAYGDGGIVKSPTIAKIGEKGPEAVIPLKNGSVPIKMPNDFQNPYALPKDFVDSMSKYNFLAEMLGDKFAENNTSDGAAKELEDIKSRAMASAGPGAEAMLAAFTQMSAELRAQGEANRSLFEAMLRGQTTSNDIQGKILKYSQ